MKSNLDIMNSDTHCSLHHVFSEFCYTSTSSETVWVFSLPYVPQLPSQEDALYGDLKCAGRAKLLTLEPYSTVWMEYSSFCWVKTFFFLFSFFFFGGGEGRQTEGQLLLVLNLEKALLYCSMFILHLKLHLTALLLSMYSQLPFMRHLSY